MTVGYGSIGAGADPRRLPLTVSRAVGVAALALLALGCVAVQLRARSAAVLEGKDLNTYPDWLKTLHGPASYTGIGEETSDFGASQHNSKYGMRYIISNYV